MNRGIIALKILSLMMLSTIIGILVWFAASFSSNIKSFIAERPKEDRIHFINVITSDSILVESNGEYGLIDTSYNENDPTSNNKNSNGFVVLDYLNKMGVKHLKFIIASHPHKDHVGGIPEIVYNSELVDENTTYIYKDVLIVPEDDDYYKHQIGYYTTAITGRKEEEDAVINAKNAMKSKNAVLLDTLSIKNSSLKKLDAKVSKDENIWDRYITFQMGDFNFKIFNLSFYVEKLNGEPYVDINSNSLVILITSKEGKKVLLMGDSTLRHDNELYYGDLIGKVDIYKASHHGYSYSNSLNLMEMIKPQYTVVTNNSSIALSRGFVIPYIYINNYGGKVYFTGDGPVVFNIGKNIIVENGIQYTSDIKEGWHFTYNKVDNKTKKIWAYVQGNQFLTGLQKINNKTYLINDDGIRLTGWQQIDGNWYYFEPYSESNLGAMIVNKKYKINGYRYTFNKEGICTSSKCKNKKV